MNPRVGPAADRLRLDLGLVERRAAFTALVPTDAYLAYGVGLPTFGTRDVNHDGHVRRISVDRLNRGATSNTAGSLGLLADVQTMNERVVDGARRMPKGRR